MVAEAAERANCSSKRSNDYRALYYQATTELLPQQLVDLTNELRRVADQQGVALLGHFASLGDLVCSYLRAWHRALLTNHLSL